MDARREIVSGLTNDEARRCLDRLVRGVYPSGVRHELCVILLRVEEDSLGGAREVLLENLEADVARSGLPPHAAVPDLLLECWAELEMLTSLHDFALRLEHDGGSLWQRDQEMDERVLPVTTKADSAARLLFPGFHERQKREREEARRHVEEAKRALDFLATLADREENLLFPDFRANHQWEREEARPEEGKGALDFLVKLGLNVSSTPAETNEDESLRQEIGPILTEDGVQFVRDLSQSLAATLAPDGKGDAEMVQAVRQRVVEWQQQEEPDEEELRAIRARRGF